MRKYSNSRYDFEYRMFMAEDYDTTAKNCKMVFTSRDTLKGKNVVRVGKSANMTYDIAIYPDPSKYGKPDTTKIIYMISQK